MDSSEINKIVEDEALKDITRKLSEQITEINSVLSNYGLADWHMKIDPKNLPAEVIFENGVILFQADALPHIILASFKEDISDFMLRNLINKPQ